MTGYEDQKDLSICPKNYQKNIPYLWTERLNTATFSTLPKLSIQCGSNYKAQKLILPFTWKVEGPECPEPSGRTKPEDPLAWVLPQNYLQQHKPCVRTDRLMEDGRETGTRNAIPADGDPTKHKDGTGAGGDHVTLNVKQPRVPQLPVRRRTKSHSSLKPHAPALSPRRTTGAHRTGATRCHRRHNGATAHSHAVPPSASTGGKHRREATADGQTFQAQ